MVTEYILQIWNMKKLNHKPGIIESQFLIEENYVPIAGLLKWTWTRTHFLTFFEGLSETSD